MQTLFIIGIFLSYFMGLLLLRKKQKSTSDYLLAVWFIVIGTHLLEYSQYLSDFWMHYPHFIAVGGGLPFAHPPLFYLYITFSLHKEKKLKPTHTLHFIPVILYYLAISPFYFYSGAEKILVMSHEMPDFSFINAVASIAIAISGILYPTMAHISLKRAHSRIRQQFSHPEEINHRWLQYSIYWVYAIFAVVIAVVFLQHIFVWETDIHLDSAIYFVIICFLVFMGYFGIRHRGIFTENEPEPIKWGAAYQKSGLKTEDAENLHRNLITHMKSEKPYFKPRLTLIELAEQLDVPHHHLSQIINQIENKNFYDFVNQYRVNEFKNRLTQPKYRHYNFLSLALDCGFNSKSSFNQVFKRSEGITPSQYLKKTQEQDVAA